MGTHREGASLTACPGVPGEGAEGGERRALRAAGWAAQSVGLGAAPALVWGVEEEGDHCFPFEGSMLQEERVCRVMGNN